MTGPFEDLDRIYEQIAKPDIQSAIDPKIARARDLVRLIERVSVGQSNQDTARAQNTVREPETRKSSTLREMHLPARIGRFEIREIIGQGGFGLVFRALDPNLNREVALKVPKTFHILSDELRERFMREGRATASLAHPNIVPVYDAGQTDSVCFLACQLVNGQSMADWFAENPPPVKPEIAVQMVATLADAMEHAHQRGILHRDIKPANILIDSDLDSGDSLAARLRITDFGLAKELTSEREQTATGDIIGTPAYMSPEQTTDYRQVGPRSDIYSLGAILHELLTGSPPFKRETLFDTIEDVRKKNVESICKKNPAVSRDLEAICLKCLEKPPDRRYWTAHELQQDLTRFLNGEPTHARKIGHTTRMLRWCYRNRLATALFAVLGISSIAVSFLLYRSENLRQLSETRGLQLNDKSEQLQSKTDQLYDAIQRLVIEVAETPELRSGGMDSLRKRLMGQASEVYAQVVDEVPDDVNLLKKYLATKMDFARLSNALDDRETALLTTNELLEIVNARLGSRNDNGQLAKQFLIFQTEALALKLMLLESNKAGRVAQKQVADQLLTLVDNQLAAVNDVDAMLAQASALSDIAASRMSENVTEAQELNDRARAIWNKIPAERISNSRYWDDLVKLYRSSIMAIASGEDSKKGLALCNEFFALLENSETSSRISPVSKKYVADIYRHNGFLLRYENTTEAIKSAERGRDLSIELAARHPLVASIQMQVTSQLYTLGLMHFIAKDFDQAIPIFVDNIGRCEQLIQRFPNQSSNGRLNLAKSLTMLGIHYKHREQWLEQLATLQKSMAIVDEDLKNSNISRYKVHKCGLLSEMAQAHAKLGEYETALELILPSIQQLEQLVDSDPGNGQARRYLANNLNRACEIHRRYGQFDEARQYLERLVEFLGEGLVTTLLPAAIEIEIAAGNVDIADEQLARYGIESAKLNSDQKLFDARQFCWAIKTLSQSGTKNGENAGYLRKRLVDLACDNLAVRLDSVENPQSEYEEISRHPDFEPLKNEPAFRELGKFD